MANATAEDIDVLTRTIFGEARGEPLEGQIAVAHVVMNRVKAARAYVASHPGKVHPLFGDGSIHSACKARLQFSCWNANDPSLPKMQAATLGDARFQKAMLAALMVALDTVPDPTGGSKHYYAPAGVSAVPGWAKGLTPIAAIGGHRFFNNVA